MIWKRKIEIADANSSNVAHICYGETQRLIARVDIVVVPLFDTKTTSLDILAVVLQKVGLRIARGGDIALAIKKFCLLGDFSLHRYSSVVGSTL